MRCYICVQKLDKGVWGITKENEKDSALENMNKVDHLCRPAASLKFTIDNILNLKTSGRKCDGCQSAGQKNDTDTATGQHGFLHREQRLELRQEGGSELKELGKKVHALSKTKILSYITHSYYQEIYQS